MTYRSRESASGFEKESPARLHQLILPAPSSYLSDAEDNKNPPAMAGSLLSGGWSGHPVRIGEAAAIAESRTPLQPGGRAFYD